MYAKVAAAGLTPAKIVFLYKRSTLFNDVSLMSSYMARDLATKDGNPITDEFNISDDEQDIVDVCIRTTLPDIYEAMSKITHAVVPAFDDCKTEIAGTKGTDIGGNNVIITAGDYVEFYIQDNEAYNANVLTMVDASLYNALKYGVLKEVYSTIVNAEFFKLCSDRFVSELFKMKSRLFQLKKKSVESNLT